MAHSILKDPLLRENEVATILAIKVTTLRRWRWSGDGPEFLKLGRSVRYAPDTIQAFMEARTRTSTSAEAAPAS